MQPSKYSIQNSTQMLNCRHLLHNLSVSIPIIVPASHPNALHLTFSRSTSRHSLGNFRTLILVINQLNAQNLVL